MNSGAHRHVVKEGVWFGSSGSSVHIAPSSDYVYFCFTLPQIACFIKSKMFPQNSG